MSFVCSSFLSSHQQLLPEVCVVLYSNTYTKSITRSSSPVTVGYFVPVSSAASEHGRSHPKAVGTGCKRINRIFYFYFYFYLFFFVFTFPCSAVVRGASIIFFPVLCRTGIQVSSRSQKLNEAGRCAGDPVFTTTAPHKLIFLLQLRKPGQPNCSAGRAGPTTLRCCGRPC